MIMTMQEARDTLRVDGEDNDEIIEPLVEAIPSYLLETTGYKWTATDGGEPHPLAVTVSKFILQYWFDGHTNDRAQLKRTIDSLLTALQAAGRKNNG